MSRSRILLLASFWFALLLGPVVKSRAQSQLADKPYAYSLGVAAPKRLSTQSRGLPEIRDQSAFEFFYQDPKKEQAIFPLRDLGGFKDEFAVLKALSGDLPFNYDPAQVKVYLVFSAEQITPGGRLLKLHSEPVAGSIDERSTGLLFLPTNYGTPAEAKALVEPLQRHFDEKRYQEIKSWKEKSS